MTKITIGRSSTNDVVLSDATVSRNHAEAEPIGRGLWRLTDVGSSAGTFIMEGGKWTQVTSAEIGANTMVRFGDSEHKLADVVNVEPATEAPKAKPESGLGQRAAASDAAPKAKPAKAPKPAPKPKPAPAPRPAGGAGAAGGGMSPNVKIGLIVGGSVLGLVLIIAIVLILTLDEGGGGMTGGGTAGGGTATGGTQGGAGGGTGGGQTAALSGARAEFARLMRTACTQRQNSNPQLCECIATGIAKRISESDAKAIIDASRSRAKPPEEVAGRMFAATMGAGRECAGLRGGSGGTPGTGGGTGGGSQGGAGGGAPKQGGGD